MKLERGDYVRLKGRSQNHHYKVVTRIETTSGMTGYWMMHPNGWFTAVRDGEIKEKVNVADE